MSAANNVVDYKLFNEKMGLFAPMVKVAVTIAEDDDLPAHYIF